MVAQVRQAITTAEIEQETFEPSRSFIAQANVTSWDLYREAEEDYEGFWGRKAAEYLDWYKYWNQVLDASDAPFYKWFVGGEINVCYNCIDRHLPHNKNKAAIIWEGEPPGETRTLTYQDLYREVNRFASVLRDQLGVTRDDVVTIYLPMIPELPIAMLACARLGVRHNVVFAGFSGQAMADRMIDSGSRFLVTCDGYYRRGDLIEHKSRADEGVARVAADVHTVVVRRGGNKIDMRSGNDHWWHELMANAGNAEVEPVRCDADGDFFIMYTSGSTAKPKGVVHRYGGYLVHIVATAKWLHDLKPDDLYWCLADIGWITGHSYIVYGPLAIGCTTLIYEGTPDYPDRDRCWEIVEKYRVDALNTAPTTIRMFRQWGPEYPQKHDLSSLRWLGTVGEPINPAAWKWYYKYIGGERCPVVDKWWQTENGGNLIGTVPALATMKPGRAGRPIPGLHADILDETGTPITEPDQGGYLVITNPWPGMLKTLYRDPQRYIDYYWSRFSDPAKGKWVYLSGDGAKRDADGDYMLLGRIDDVMNVAGHRLSTMEMESAIVSLSEVAEAAVVSAEHEQKGEVPWAFVILEEGVKGDDGLKRRINQRVREMIGPIASLDKIHFVPDLPKTRSGKIMRRLLEDVARYRPLGDTTTLRNPEIAEQIRQLAQGS
jgi:acetyl-CoA synthetase